MARSLAGPVALALMVAVLAPASAPASIFDLNVERVSGGGTSTGAGVPATDFQLQAPRLAAALDLGGPLRQFVVDSADCRFRKVTPPAVGNDNTGTIDVIAGNGCGTPPSKITSASDGTSTPIGNPNGIDGDPPGGGFIFTTSALADRFDAGTSKVVTIAGTGSCGSPPADGSLALDANLCQLRAIDRTPNDGDRFLVSSEGSGGPTFRPRVFEVNGTTIKTIAGGCATSGANALQVCFTQPWAIAYSWDSGTFYVADRGTGKVWRFSASDSSVAVEIASGLTSPNALAANFDGSLFVSDGSCQIRRIDNPSGVSPTVTNLLSGPPCGDFEAPVPLSVPLGQAQIFSPLGLSMATTGLYVVDGLQATVRLIDRTAITSGPSRVTNQTTAGFTYESLDSEKTFQCQASAGPPIASCPTQQSPLGPLAEGLYGLLAQATGHGYHDASYASWDWTVDTTPPSAAQITEPADGATKLPPGVTVKWNPVHLKDPQELPPDGRYEILDGGTKVGELVGDCGAAGKPACAATTSPLGTGAHELTLRTVDSAGNPATSPAIHISVGGPPTAAMTIAPNPALTGRAVTFDGSQSTDPDEAPIARYEWDFDGDGSFETDNGGTPAVSQTFNVTGSFKVGLRVTDRDGETGTTQQTLQVNSASGPGLFGVSIENGAQYTRTPNVTVTANFPPTTTRLLFSNDGGFFAPATFTPKKTIAWRLDSSGPERLPKTIYVRFGSGSILSETYQDDIILDETPPVVQQAAVVPAAGAASIAGLRKFTVKVRAKDSNSGVSKLQITVNKRKPGKLLKYRKKVVVKASSRKLWVRARDRAGNFSRWKKAR